MDEAQKLALKGWATLPPFKQKIAKAKDCIAEALAIAPAYVGCSWGKDSLALAHLVYAVDSSVLMFHDGSTDEDEQDNYSKVRESFLSRFPMPYRGIERGYDQSGLWPQMPSEPMAFLGLRAEESGRRKRSLIKHGLIHQYASSSGHRTAGHWRCCPLAWWTWRDVWAYILSHDLAYLKSYDHWSEGLDKSRTTVTHGRKILSDRPDAGFGRAERIRIKNNEFWSTLDV